MKKAKVVVVMPAHNVAKVLAKTVSGIPQGWADEIILVNDGSTDGTDEVGRKLGLTVISHEQSKGYGAAQKSGYREAIRKQADIAVMVHGDNQYDPSLVPQFVSKIVDEGYDVVTGTRMVLGDVLRNGMPLWKFIPNRFLTWLENLVFQTHLTDYHNGYRAFSAPFLKEVPIDLLSDKFDFDTDIIVQAAIRRAKVAEIPHTTRYENENSKMSFTKGIRYGLSILWTMVRYLLHKSGVYRQKLFGGT